MSVKISLPPGVVLGTSLRAVGARWSGCNRVRFVAGRPEQIGGWEKRINEETLGRARGLLGWVATSGTGIATLGTYIKLYAATDGYDDITPYRLEGTLALDPFAVTNLSATVIVTHTAHGLTEGAYVHYSGATAGGGITINGEYVVTQVDDANTFRITHSAPATSTDATTGGAAVAYGYEINPGYDDTVIGTGYGAGDYGSGDYGEPSSSGGITFEMRTWFLETWGNNLLAAHSAGTLYYWDQIAAEPRAVAVANAPESMRAMFVTAEGYPTALGCADTAVPGVGSPMTMAWPDRDDIEDWAPTNVNRANVRTLDVGNKLIAGTKVSDVNLIWSDTAAYIHQFVGDIEKVYDTRLLAENAGLLGPRAFAVAGEPAAAFWMSSTGFMMFDGGGVRPMPNQMDVREAIYRSMDTRYAQKFWAAYNAKKGEIWFGYVRTGATEPDAYVIFNLQDNSWAPGLIDRTDMSHIPSAGNDPIATGIDRYLYSHETGVSADGEPMLPYIRTGMLDIAKGDADMDIDRYIHDVGRQTGPMVLTIEVYERPNSASPFESFEVEIQQGDVEADLHIGGRHAVVGFSATALFSDFRLEVPSFEVKKAGER